LQDNRRSDSQENGGDDAENKGFHDWRAPLKELGLKESGRSPVRLACSAPLLQIISFKC
jgi:hypothetical protein